MNFIYDYGNIPIQIGTANDWQSIYAGCGHSFAIKTNGTLWAWGWNSIGQLGTGTNSHVPIQVGTSTNWQSASAGGTHSVALKTDGTLWAWGSNQYGQLGNGTTNNSYVPIQIGTATDWQNVSAGLYWHTTALKTDGTLWAWGDNEYGQLGDSTYIDSNIPIPSIEGNCSTSTCSITAQFTLPTTPNCANTAYAFTNTSTGAANYQWKVNGTNVGTTTNLTYTFPTAGTYTIMLEATNGTTISSEIYSTRILNNNGSKYMYNDINSPIPTT
jgi:alpha-tubulin suppressor-like RCC1 family protein